MMLRFAAFAFVLWASIASSFAAGTIPFSLSQQFDSLGKPLAGCQFFTIQAGTTSTPQSAYQDSALTIALPNPKPATRPAGCRKCSLRTGRSRFV